MKNNQKILKSKTGYNTKEAESVFVELAEQKLKES